jgi:hypothetical protein
MASPFLSSSKLQQSSMPLQTDDLSPEVHAELDEDVNDFVSSLSFESNAPLILSVVLNGCQKAYEPQWPINMPDQKVLKELVMEPDLRALLETSFRTGKYSEIRKQCKSYFDAHRDLHSLLTSPVSQGETHSFGNCF